MKAHRAEAEIKSANNLYQLALTAARSARLAATKGQIDESEALAASAVAEDARLALARRVRRYVHAWGVRGAAEVLRESERVVTDLVTFAEDERQREWLTVSEAALFLGVSVATVQRIAQERQGGVLAVQSAPEKGSKTSTGKWLLLRADLDDAFRAGLGRWPARATGDDGDGARAAEAEEAARRG